MRTNCTKFHEGKINGRLFLLEFNALKRIASMIAFVLLSTLAYSQPTVPFAFTNSSTFSDANVYVAIVGIVGGNHVWIDAKNSSIRTMSTADNTVQGPINGGDGGPGLNGKYAACFARLSEIPNKTVNIPGIAGCRILISFNSQLYLYFFGATGGYAAPNLANSNDPNQGIRFEMIELTNAPNGLWANTTRVDSYQYPMGLEVWGNSGFYQKVGEIKTHDQIIAQWKAQAPGEFQPCLNAAQGIIKYPSKNAQFQPGGASANYLGSYIDQIWSKFTGGDLVFSSGDAGIWRGRVSGSSFRFTRASDGQVATITNKPTTQEAMEGSGVLAAGAQWDKVVQAQICAAINRHAIDLNMAVGATQDFATPSKYYITGPYNWYCKFWHGTDITLNSKTYAFCYDDVFNQSSTINAPVPTRAVVAIGGYAGTNPPPPPTGIVSGAIYSVINVNSNKAMEVGGFSTADGGNVQQWDYVGAASQKWRVTDVGGGAYSLINIHSGKSLDVAGVSTADGANVHQWGYVGGNNQKWQIINNGDATYRIIAVHSGKSVEVGGFSTVNGGNVQQWAYVAAASQKWRFTSVAAAAREVAISENETSSIEESYIISPNPVNRILTIKGAKGGSLGIITTDGKQLSKSFMQTDDEDVSHLTPGIYHAVLIKNNKRFVQRFVKAQ